MKEDGTDSTSADFATNTPMLCVKTLTREYLTTYLLARWEGCFFDGELENWLRLSAESLIPSFFFLCSLEHRCLIL
jgi:hypothetical protein